MSYSRRDALRRLAAGLLKVKAGYQAVPGLGAALGASPMVAARELSSPSRVKPVENTSEEVMGFGKGALLWLLGIPLPIILLLALFWR